MAHLWILASLDAAAASDVASWTLRAFDGALTVGSAHLTSAATPHGPRWVVIGPPSVRVNGTPLVAEIAILRDRDELWIEGERLFFSTEMLALVVAFPGADRPLRCPRCTGEIAAAEPAVACPQCGVWHHQKDGRECWTYAPSCATCDHPSAFDVGYRFDPETL